ncbi:UNVERIFIED_CONTAM: hypothetical protein Slati_0145400 [Sesamum latifolium]|uniref:Uncharacterized protein n=1 Tax=Sesamum latifolium TaxID=2727402 RepID=A0AAW2YA05_9LAMI
MRCLTATSRLAATRPPSPSYRTFVSLSRAKSSPSTAPLCGSNTPQLQHSSLPSTVPHHYVSRPQICSVSPSRSRRYTTTTPNGDVVLPPFTSTASIRLEPSSTTCSRITWRKTHLQESLLEIGPHRLARLPPPAPYLPLMRKAHPPLWKMRMIPATTMTIPAHQEIEPPWP